MEQRGRRLKDSDLGPAIRRGRYDKLTIYEISEDELELLERGSPDSILLNFSVFALSVFVSFLIALVTTTIESDRTFTVFVVVTAVAALGGVVLFSLWWRSRRTMSRLTQAIRRRLPPEEGVQETQLPPASPPNT